MKSSRLTSAAKLSQRLGPNGSRSAIFYTDLEQYETAKQYMKSLDAAKVFENPIVTELSPLEVFYDAEDDHDRYYDLNREQPYCTYLIDPKIKKLTTHFNEILK